ncbi:MAG: STAS domain-containing protein [Alphaproteobacteria bacterium]|nr:STAS domain-containing protein [Alphaproteobacteria bacterium]
MTVPLKERFEKGFIILQPCGRMDSQTSPDLLPSIESKLRDSTKNVVLDLAEVPYVSSAGLRIFLLIAKQVAAARGKFAITSLRPEIREVLTISGLSSILQIYDTPQSALSALEAG